MPQNCKLVYVTEGLKDYIGLAQCEVLRNCVVAEKIMQLGDQY